MPIRCPLFAGYGPEQLQQALTLLQAREEKYPANTTLKSTLQPLAAFGLVLEGAVQVTMADLDGREMLLAYVSPGQTFGESLCWLGQNAPIVITAQSACRILWMRIGALRSATDSPMRAELMSRFTAMLARRTLDMNDRIQILSRRSIREKLKAYFTICVRDSGQRTFHVPFDRSGMAAYLGTDRSALSRELSRMRREGLLEFDKNQFTLHLQQTSGAEPDIMMPAEQPERRK